MLRCWKPFTVPILFFALAAAPAPQARAAGQEKDRLKKMAEHLESLDTTLKQTFTKVWEEFRSIRQELKTAGAERADAQVKLELALGKINALDKLVAEIRRDLDALKKGPAPDPAAPSAERTTLEEIKVRLTVIEKQLAQLPAQGRVALYPPGASEAGTPREERPRHDDRLRQLEKSLRHLTAALKRGLGGLHEQVKACHRDLRNLKDEQARAEWRVEKALARASVQAQLAEVRAELMAKTAAPTQVAYYPPAATSSGALEEINRRLGRIEDRVAQASVSRIAYYSAPTISFRPAVTSFAAPAPVGRLVLVNSRAEDVTVMVNGRSHPVARGARLTLDNLPAGSLWYEVITPSWGPRGRRTTNLAANETLTVSIR
jgi:DNA repair exonuclease SbcCD ATPase subunit